MIFGRCRSCWGIRMCLIAVGAAQGFSNRKETLLDEGLGVEVVFSLLTDGAGEILPWLNLFDPMRAGVLMIRKWCLGAVRDIEFTSERGSLILLHGFDGRNVPTGNCRSSQEL